MSSGHRSFRRRHGPRERRHRHELGDLIAVIIIFQSGFVALYHRLRNGMLHDDTSIYSIEFPTQRSRVAPFFQTLIRERLTPLCEDGLPPAFHDIESVQPRVQEGTASTVRFVFSALEQQYICFQMIGTYVTESN